MMRGADVRQVLHVNNQKRIQLRLCRDGMLARILLSLNGELNAGAFGAQGSQELTR